MHAKFLPFSLLKLHADVRMFAKQGTYIRSGVCFCQQIFQSRDQEMQDILRIVQMRASIFFLGISDVQIVFAVLDFIGDMEI